MQIYIVSDDCHIIAAFETQEKAFKAITAMVIDNLDLEPEQHIPNESDIIDLIYESQTYQKFRYRYDEHDGYSIFYISEVTLQK